MGKKSAIDTAQRIVTMLRHMDRRLPIREIGARHITAAMNARRVEPIRRGKNKKATGAYPSNGTVNRDIIDSTLRPILNYAATNLEADVKRIPWSDLRLPEVRQRVRLTEAFFSLDAIRGDDVYTRERKNGPQVVTLLPDDAADIRARAGRARAAGLDTVWFREMKSGELRAIQPRGFQSAAATSLKRAGVEDARAVHDARHHAGTMMLRGSGNLAAVKELLGHENIQSTMRYAHTSREDLRRTLRHVYGTIEGERTENPSKDKTVNGS